MLPWALLFVIRQHARKHVAETTLPPGLKPWAHPVTPAITEWAKGLLNDPTGHPMGALETKVFPEGTITARVEKHTWTYRNNQLVRGNFRGITLYEGAPL